MIKKLNKSVVIANPIYQKRFEHIELNKIKSNYKKKIFISYSHEDRVWLDRLLFHLSPLKYKNIEYWFDENIQIGDKFSEAIVETIQNSHMIICLISPYFLSSEFIRTREVPAFINRQNEGIVIFPVLLEECLWDVVEWISEIQIFPKDAKPLNDFSEKEQNKKIMEIVRYITEILG